MFVTTLQEDRDWICAPQGLVDGGIQGPFQGTSLLGVQPRAGALWSPDSVNAESPSGGDLPLKSMALPALGTGTPSKGDAGREGWAVPLTRDRKFL